MNILEQGRATNPNFGSIHSIIGNGQSGMFIDALTRFGEPIVEDCCEAFFVWGFAPVDAFGFWFVGEAFGGGTDH